MLEKRVDTYLCNFHGLSIYLYSLTCFHQLIKPLSHHIQNHIYVTMFYLSILIWIDSMAIDKMTPTLRYIAMAEVWALCLCPCSQSVSHSVSFPLQSLSPYHSLSRFLSLSLSLSSYSVSVSLYLSLPIRNMKPTRI